MSREEARELLQKVKITNNPYQGLKPMYLTEADDEFWSLKSQIIPIRD